MTFDTRSELHRASQGDAAAVEALLVRYLPGLERYIERHAGSWLSARESASDLVQSTCREILQKPGRFQYDGEEGFRRWLYATALRKIRDRHRFYRADRRNVGREAPKRPPGESATTRGDTFVWSRTPSQDAAAREELARLYRALAKLPASYREIVVLSKIEQCSAAEVGKRLGISESYARTLLSRALARLARVARELEGER